MVEWASRDLVFTTVHKFSQMSTAPRTQPWVCSRLKSVLWRQTRLMWPLMEWSLASALLLESTTAVVSHQPCAAGGDGCYYLTRMAILCKSSEKGTGRRTLVLVLVQWLEDKSRALDVVVGTHTKWHGIGHGEVAPEFLRHNCWTWTAEWSLHFVRSQWFRRGCDPSLNATWRGANGACHAHC